MVPHLLRIDCVDEPGLVHKITGVLFKAGYNILSNQEFVDASSGHFFMRTAFEGTTPPQPVVSNLEQILPPAAVVKLTAVERQPVVILATAETHCLGDLLIRHYSGEFPGDIRAVIANHETLAPLVRQFGIPFHHVGHKDLDRAAHEKLLAEAIDGYRPEYIILAKYMRILTPSFVGRYSNRIINIHHSFLPAFAGARPYHQAHERGVKIIGATAHYVTPELDQGPIIEQDVARVSHRDAVADLVRKGRDLEKTVLARAVDLHLRRRIVVYGNKTVVFD